MRVLHEGLTGKDVEAWQTFLRGWSKKGNLLANGTFDAETKKVTQEFQLSAPNVLEGDGVVGNLTTAKALKLGFSILEDTRADENSYNWPPKPAGAKWLTDDERYALFGKFAFEPAPTASNPEGIKITDDWAKKNIVTVEIPQLIGIKGAPKSGKISFHRLAAKQLQDAFKALEERDQLKYLKSWGGSWVPRFIRGSKTRLSNHSLAGAFDCNVEWNMLGTHGALKGQEGSVREMVLTLMEHGLYWGGYFVNRPDPQHFEIFKIL